MTRLIVACDFCAAAGAEWVVLHLVGPRPRFSPIGEVSESTARRALEALNRMASNPRAWDAAAMVTAHGGGTVLACEGCRKKWLALVREEA